MLIDPTEDSTPPLTATWNGADGQRSLRVSGELDIATAPQLATALEGELRPGTRVMLDLADLTFIHAAGLRVLVGVGPSCGVPVGSCCNSPSSTVQRVLAVAGLRRLRSVNDRNASMNATVLWVIAAIGDRRHRRTARRRGHPLGAGGSRGRIPVASSHTPPWGLAMPTVYLTRPASWSATAVAGAAMTAEQDCSRPIAWRPRGSQRRCHPQPLPQLQPGRLRCR